MRVVYSPIRRRDLEMIGQACRKFRKDRGITLYEVAKNVCTSMENVSMFESGKNDCATIYNWYLQMGMPVVKTYESREDYNPFDYCINERNLEDFNGQV